MVFACCSYLILPFSPTCVFTLRWWLLKKKKMFALIHQFLKMEQLMACIPGSIFYACSPIQDDRLVSVHIVAHCYQQKWKPKHKSLTSLQIFRLGMLRARWRKSTKLDIYIDTAVMFNILALVFCNYNISGKFIFLKLVVCAKIVLAHSDLLACTLIVCST